MAGMAFHQDIGSTRHTFADLKTLLAKASPARSGDQLAGVAAASAAERVAARLALADLPLRRFLDEAVVPYEDDEVTRLIVDTPRRRPPSRRSRILTVGGFRDWLLADAADTRRAGRPGARASRRRWRRRCRS